MVMQLSWLPAAGKKIWGGERQSGEQIPAVVNPSVVGAAELGGNTAPHEQDITHRNL